MALMITIKVVPQSGKQECKHDKNGGIKCYLKSPPEQGKANQELITFLSKKLKVSQEAIKIVRGQTSRNKSLHITTLDDLSEFYVRLGIETQTKIQ